MTTNHPTSDGDLEESHSHKHRSGEKIKSFQQYHTNCKEEWVGNCCEGGMGIVNSPYQRKEE